MFVHWKLKTLKSVRRGFNRVQKARKCIRLRELLQSSLCFKKTPLRMNFIVKFLPQDLTTRFWGCIFAVLFFTTDYTDFHRLFSFSPQSNTESHGVFLLFLVIVIQTTAGRKTSCWGLVRKIWIHPLRKKLAVFPRSFAVALDDNRGEREDSVSLHLCVETTKN